jgi:5'-methylthioadenosine phosphorylase
VGRLAVVAGSALFGVEPEPREWEVIQRHGHPYTLPHRIDHGANLERAADAGCDRVLAICSVGGVQPQFGPGTFLCPDDFISLGPYPSTFDGPEAHLVPGFDFEWRGQVLERWAEAAEPVLVDGGTYWQSLGPRLETAAEIRMISGHADVVGMTLGSECAVACELGLAYASVCVVDNYANGVGEEPLTLDELERGRAENAERLRATLDAVLPLLA